MPKNREKRSSPRKTYIVPLIFVCGDKKTSAYVHDISTGGAFITTKNPSQSPLINTELELIFVLPGSGIIHIQANVLWRNQNGFGVQFLNPGVVIVKTIGNI